MNRWWLAASIPAFVIFAVLLVRAVTSLVALTRTPPLAAVPLVATQDVRLQEPGEVVLHAEGPHLTTAFAGSSYTLVNRDTGQSVPLHPIVFRAKQSGFSTVRLSLASLTLDAPGTYTLSIGGLQANADYTRCRIVFSRDTRAQLVGRIVAVVLCGVAVIGTLVLSILVLAVRA